MKSKIIWLKVLFVLWILTGILWIGFALPKTQASSSNKLENTLKHSSLISLDGIEFEIPSSIVSKPGLSTILINKAHKSIIENLANIIDSSDIMLSITGYYSNNENASVGQKRALQFKRELIKHQSINQKIITRSQKRDNLESDFNYIYDVIGINIKRKEISNPLVEAIRINFEDDSFKLIEHQGVSSKLKELNRAIDLDKRKMIIMTLFSKKPYDNIVSNNALIRKIKEEMVLAGIPSFKIVGDIAESNNLESEYYLEIELN